MKNGEGAFLKELYIQGRNLLRESGVENPELEAALLLSKVLGINTTYMRSEERRVGKECRL